LGQALSAGLDKFRLTTHTLRKKSETLEYGPIAELLGIGNEFLRLRIFPLEIPDQAIVHVTDTTPDGRIVEHVDDGFGWARHRHASLAAPHIARAEKRAFRRMLEQERQALNYDFLAAHLSRGEHACAPKQLFGQPPMLSGAPASDAGGAKKFRHHNPRVFKNLVLPKGSERHWRVIAGPQSLHPALLVPAGE
jgi:hypothetical protein